jgi:hypothetical protein
VLKNFAEKYHLKIKRDECGDVIIPGIIGHIGDGYGKLLGLYVNAETSKAWTFTRRKLESAGMTIRQNGDVDGVAVFDPANREQARLALKVTKVKTRRMASPPTPAQLAARATFAESRRTHLKAA